MALLLVVALLLMSMVPAAGAQRPAPPPPSGKHIVARDGDVVVIENEARIGIVRRREASVRMVFNAADRWLVVLVDHATSTAPPDGRVDWTYHYSDVAGTWPFEARWEGAATIDEYSMIPNGVSEGLGIATSQGLVQLLGREQEFRDPDAVAVLSFAGAGSGGANRLGFDETERWVMPLVRRNGGAISLPPGSGGAATLSVQGGLAGAVTGRATTVITGGMPIDPNGAVRVGGRVRPPKKIADVPPQVPEDATLAGIRGIVVVEVTIDVDGTVKDARILRSIPMLDEAALGAVRQWRYEPTTIDGRAVPVIMTVSVPFR